MVRRPPSAGPRDPLRLGSGRGGAALLALLLLALVLVGCGSDGDGDPAADGTTVERTEPPRTPADPATAPEREDPAPELSFARLPGITTMSEAGEFGEGLAGWRQAVPGIVHVHIPSTADDHRQPALWLPPDADEPRPPMVIVHSWSSGYLQHINIPLAQWARQHDWAAIVPQFRGPFDRPEATGSNRAVQDVVDAIDFAIARGGVDPDRVFVIGVSGGGMKSLLMAGRHPDRFAGAVSWVPVYDLVSWYAYNRDEQPDRHYAGDIRRSCGGDPAADARARRSCEHRSPAAHLDDARAARLPVYIAVGLDDRVVPPDHALRAYNQLADAGDRLAGPVVAAAAESRLPGALRGSDQARTFFEPEDPDVILSRSSGPVTLVVFDGEHDMVYHPGLEWMVRLAAEEDEA
jgi:predicted esterase